MADLATVAASVGVVGAGARTQTVQAGEAIGTFKSVFKNTSDNKWYRSDANDGTKQKAEALTLCASGAADEFVVICTEGELDPGVSMTVGDQFFASDNAGEICTYADLASASAILPIGVAKEARVLKVRPFTLGATKP